MAVTTCCCCDLRTGAIIIGIIHAVIDIINVYNGATSLSAVVGQKNGDVAVGIAAVTLVIGLISLLTVLLLLYVTCQSLEVAATKKKLVLPWIVWSSITALGYVVLGAVYVYYLGLFAIFFVLMLFFALVMTVYFIVMISFYYKMLGGASASECI